MLLLDGEIKDKHTKIEKTMQKEILERKGELDVMKLKLAEVLKERRIIQLKINKMVVFFTIKKW